MGPWAFIGTLKGTYRVYCRYIRIPGVKGPYEGPMVSTLDLYKGRLYRGSMRVYRGLYGFEGF